MSQTNFESTLSNLPPFKAVSVACYPVIFELEILQCHVEHENGRFDESGLGLSLFKFASQFHRDLKLLDNRMEIIGALSALRLGSTKCETPRCAGFTDRTWAELVYKIGWKAYLGVLEELNVKQFLEFASAGKLLEKPLAGEEQQSIRPIAETCAFILNVDVDELRTEVDREADRAESLNGSLTLHELENNKNAVATSETVAPPDATTRKCDTWLVTQWDRGDSLQEILNRFNDPSRRKWGPPSGESGLRQRLDAAYRRVKGTNYPRRPQGRRPGK